MTEKKKMGFDIERSECEDCEEEELTEVQDGQASPEGEPNAYDIAEIFLESVEKLRAMGAVEIAMFDCAVKFAAPFKEPEPTKKPEPTKRKPKPLIPDGLPGDTEDDIKRRQNYAAVVGVVTE
jgi:hypothetical protein